MDTTYDRSSVASASVEAAAVTPSATIREEIRARFQAKVLPQPIRLPVPCMPGVSAWFSPNVTGDMLLDYGQRAGVDMKSDAPPTDEQNARSSAMLLADTCLSIMFGENVWNEDGEAVTFQRQAFFDLVGDENRTEAVRKFYGVDSDVMLAAQQVIANSGLSTNRIVPIKGR